MTCLSNKVFFGSCSRMGLRRLAVGLGRTHPENIACEVAQLCVCAIFTLFQYHAYVQVSKGGRGLGEERGPGAGGGARFGLSVLSVRFLVSVFRLRQFQVCTSNVRKLNFSWLPQKCRSVWVCECASVRVSQCSSVCADYTHTRLPFLLSSARTSLPLDARKGA